MTAATDPDDVADADGRCATVPAATIAGTTIRVGDRLAHGDDDPGSRTIVGIERGHPDPDVADDCSWWLVVEEFDGRRTRLLAGDVAARIQHGATATRLRRADDGG